MHGTSLSGVSFTRLSHCEELTAAAPVGTSRTATAQHSGTSHRSRNRDPLLTGMRASLSLIWCFRTAPPNGSHDARCEAPPELTGSLPSAIWCASGSYASRARNTPLCSRLSAVVYTGGPGRVAARIVFEL